jgi:pyruvate, orthophosphate dikinase
MSPKKMVYFFGGEKADGKGSMKELLGGKGANLAEMCTLGIPVPAGFTITTEVCSLYYENGGKLTKELEKEVIKSLKKTEKVMGRGFGDAKNPLLLSVRSGARMSMPGMMDTVLNIGLDAKTIPGLIAQTGNERFVYDAYRRLIMMYADVVMEKAEGIEPEDGQSVRMLLEEAMEDMKKELGIEEDTDLEAESLIELCETFKKIIKKTLGKPFPENAMEQLWGGVKAVFQSWNGKRAISYRNIEGIPHNWGTAVNVQSMVYGNLGDTSATGVAFTRDPATGENKFYGEWLINAQGEDVVAGTRTPSPLNIASKTSGTQKMVSLEEAWPKLYKQFVAIRNKLEKHYHDMQDLEFTIQDGEFYMLQTRTGKRTGTAAIRMAVEMANEKMIDKKTALMRVVPEQLDELLHPMLDPKAEKKAPVIAKGLPAGPGGGVGQVVFTSDTAAEWAKNGKIVILVRNETSPEDVHGMHAAEAILTAKGGMTSHAALVARGWGKCCIVGCSSLSIDARGKKMVVDGKTYKEGDYISLNGSTGNVFAGQVPVLPANPEKNKNYKQLMVWADEVRELGVRTNAESPADAAQAIKFGAEGIGLCRTEHMFFEPERITHVREMILADNAEDRQAAVNKLLPFQKKDFLGIFKAMKGMPVTVRLLDPPLHEFVGSLIEDGKVTAELKELSEATGIPVKKIKSRIEELHEFNPMLGHRGCRLGNAYPEITEMQARAILEATAQLQKKNVDVLPEIMVPLVGHVNELIKQKAIIMDVAAQVEAKHNIKLKFMVGTMIEIPRAALTADQIAEEAEFFSFGTNDLTQMGFGFSRDDINGFLPIYLEENILPEDPFQSLDQEGIGQLVEIGIEKGRSTKPDLKVGICGEHGGDPKSVVYCHNVGMNYVSCSPFRVPIARFAAAQAAILNPRNAKPAPKKPGRKAKK